MKLRFAALRINSIDMKMTMMFRRVSTPATPMMKSSAPITRNFDRSGLAAACFISSNRLSACCKKIRLKKLNINRLLRSALIRVPRIHVVYGSFLFKRARQHHRSDNRHQQQHARDLKRQRCVTIETAADALDIFTDAATA